MAVLSDPDRLEGYQDYAQKNSADRVTFGAVTKADLRAAFNALDDFFNTNAATINAAIPQPARGVLTSTQKALLLTAVIGKRYIKGV